MPAILRLFPGPDGPAPAPAPAVPVSLGALLAETGGTGGPAWADDFADDTVLISADLADVLHAARALAAGSGPVAPAAGRRRAA